MEMNPVIILENRNFGLMPVLWYSGRLLLTYNINITVVYGLVGGYEPKIIK